MKRMLPLLFVALMWEPAQAPVDGYRMTVVDGPQVGDSFEYVQPTFNLSRLWAPGRQRVHLMSFRGERSSEPTILDIYRDEAWTPIGAGTKSSAGAVVYRAVERN